MRCIFEESAFFFDFSLFLNFLFTSDVALSPSLMLQLDYVISECAL